MSLQRRFDMCATILHVDIINFYAGVEIRDCRRLHGLLLLSAGIIEARHGIVLAKIILQRVSEFKPQKPSCLRLENAPIFRLSPRISKNTSKPCVKAVNSHAFQRQNRAFRMDEAWLDVTAYAPTVERRPRNCRQDSQMLSP